MINDVADSDTFNPIKVQNKQNIRLPSNTQSRSDYIPQIYIDSDEGNEPITGVDDNRNLVQDQGKEFVRIYENLDK